MNPAHRAYRAIFGEDAERCGDFPAHAWADDGGAVCGVSIILSFSNGWTGVADGAECSPCVVCAGFATANAAADELIRLWRER